MITFRAAASNTSDGGSTLIIDKPTGTENNDVMLAIISPGGDLAITPPAGWTLISNINRASIYRKTALSEGANYTFSLPSVSQWSGGIMSFKGVDTNNPVETSSGQFSNGASITAPSAAYSESNIMAVFLAGSRGTGTFTPPSGMTEAFDTGNYSASTGAYVMIASGATGDKTATGPSDYYTAWIVCLRPKQNSSFLLNFI